MILSELIQRSPVRVFEKSIHGGLKAGDIGIIASPSGVGKTSVLVQIALDKLLQGKKVIHVSFTQHTDYVLAWYEDIFDEFTKKKNLENAGEVKNEAVKRRVLMKFTQGGVSGDQILWSLRALIQEGGFNAEALIIDGYDFSAAEEGHIGGVKSLARDLGLSVWYSCAAPGEKGYDQRKIPLVLRNCEEHLDAVIVLDPRGDHIELTVSKDRDAYNPAQMALRLDPKTLLILEE
jgi:hypothetical protein